MFEFVWIWAFLLLPAPWLLRLLLPALNSKGSGAIRVPFYRQLDSLCEHESALKTSSSLRHLVLATVWLLTLTAAANPIWIGEPETLPTAGRDLMLAVDLSESMLREDMQSDQGVQSRFEAVTDVVSEFVERRRGDRLGLILFGSQAYFQTPLTFDRNTVATQLGEATLAGRRQVFLAGGATAIGDAIGIAIKNLREQEESSRVLILLTDGANTAGSDPRRAIEVAADERIRIHTVGVGTDRQSLSLFGFGFPTSGSDIDEELLTEIAEKTGGNYFRARDTEELEQIYALIDQLEPLPEEAYYRPRKSIFHWPLGAALALAAIGALVFRGSGAQISGAAK